MKALLKIVLVAAFYNVSLVTTSTSSELNHQFKNPAFSGQGYSSHVLSIEQLQHNREKENREKKAADEAAAKREEANKTINKFLTNVESRIYANLSKQLVDRIRMLDNDLIRLNTKLNLILEYQEEQEKNKKDK